VEVLLTDDAAQSMDI